MLGKKQAKLNQNIIKEFPPIKESPIVTASLVSNVTVDTAFNAFLERIYTHNIAQEQPKDNNMFRQNENIEITQRNFILSTLQDAWYQKDTLKKDFYLEDDPPPRTAKELIQRVTDGMYALPTKEDEDNSWDECPFHMIRWRDPAKKEDRDGYKAAQAQRKVDFEAAKATIILKDIVAGQAAMEEFRTKKYN